MVLVIDLKDKYQNDPFFRTESNVILFQILFSISIIICVYFAFTYLYYNFTENIIKNILSGISQGKIIEGSQILKTVEQVKNENLIAISIFISIITVIFGYFVVKATLTPARNALASQKRFISNIAHELRTPLSVIKTNSEVALIEDSIGPHVRKTLIKSTIEELDRTSDIINNLLSINNMVRPDKLNFTHVDLGKVIDTITPKLGRLALGKHLELIIKKIEPHSVWGNVTALEQIVINLLRNAISYTQKGGKIIVTTTPDYKGNVLLVVEDNGMGIAQEDLFHIFEPFYRGERSRNRQSGGGSGLGLTIVSELIKIHGGKITIKSTVNKGTTATVILPYSKAETPESEKNIGSEISMDFLEQNQIH